MARVTCFRLYPEPGRSLFYHVRLFPTQDALRDYLRADSDVDRSAAFGSRALCTRWMRTRTLPNGRTRTCPDLGELLFVVPLIDSEAISHECAHAAIWWARRVGISPFHIDASDTEHRFANADEERYCYALGRMVLAITQRIPR